MARITGRAAYWRQLVGPPCDALTDRFDRKVLRMPHEWYTLCEIKRNYEIASLNDVIECAKKANVSARRGAAKVSRSQLKKMHPYLMQKAAFRRVRESSAKKNRRLVYESSDTHSGFMDEADRLKFSGEELFRHLYPHLGEVDDDETA